MILPLQITSRNLELTEAIKVDIREHAEKLDTYYDRIMSCRVTVEALPKRSLYNVHIDITVPGVELVVKLDPNTDLLLSIQAKFNLPVSSCIISITKYSYPWIGAPFLYNVLPLLVAEYDIYVTRTYNQPV